MANPFVAHRYDVFSSTDLETLIKQVNESLGKGAKPVGGITHSIRNNRDTGTCDYYLQAMAIPLRS